MARRLISRRVKEALAAAKARGKKLGGDRGVRPSEECLKASAATRRANAAARASDVMPVIEALREGGTTSLHAIAAGLNAQGILTPRRAERWRPAQVARLLRCASSAPR